MPRELPMVSVVTPSFNQADYLEQTMLSVLEQDYPCIEYFVMDGGSSDGSLEIIKKYAPRLAGWVSEKDKGQADAVNKGFRQANGEIVGWLNSDDFYYPGAIASAVKVFEAHPEASIVFSDVNSVDGEGKPFNRMRFGDWKLEDLMKLNIISQPGVFMRRSVLEEAGFLDLSFHYLLDVELWLRMTAIAEPFYAPDMVWSAARFHEEAKNIAKAQDFGAEAFRIAKWLCEDPRFYPTSARLFRKIWAGAHRLNAFYLVEAGDYKGAINSYGKMLKNEPLQAPRTYSRMTKTLLNATGITVFDKLYDHARTLRGKRALQKAKNDKNSGETEQI